MKAVHVLILTLSLTLHAEDTPVSKFPELVTKNGKKYTDVTVIEKLPAGIKIMHSTGVAKLKAENIPDAYARQLGGFRPEDIRHEKEMEQRDKDRATDRQEDKRKEEAIRAAIGDLYQPFSGALAAQRANVTDRELFEQLKESVAILESTCEPLLKSRQASPQTIRHWSQLAADGSVCVGMPESIALLSMGEPHRISRTSNGVDTWDYGKNGWLTVENGFVTYWTQ